MSDPTTGAPPAVLAVDSHGCVHVIDSENHRVQRIEFDHRQEWRETHHTRLDEGDGLCGHCHDLKTRFGWALVAGTGKRPIVPPDDPRHPKNKPKQG